MKRCLHCNFPLREPSTNGLCIVCADSPPAHSTQGIRNDEPRRDVLARLTNDGVNYGHEKRTIRPM